MGISRVQNFTRPEEPHTSCKLSYKYIKLVYSKLILIIERIGLVKPRKT